MKWPYCPSMPYLFFLLPLLRSFLSPHLLPSRSRFWGAPSSCSAVLDDPMGAPDVPTPTQLHSLCHHAFSHHARLPACPPMQIQLYHVRPHEDEWERGKATLFPLHLTPLACETKKTGTSRVEQPPPKVFGWHTCEAAPRAAPIVVPKGPLVIEKEHRLSRWSSRLRRP
jgi:hypothetical protein